VRLPPRIKVCGITTEEDALRCIDLGIDAIGLNFVPASPRAVTPAVARAIADRVRGRTLIVGVVADLDPDALSRLSRAVGLDCLQLHGDEPPELVSTFLPHAYKAIRVGDFADVERARSYPGEHILVDAKVQGALGGTGARLDAELVVALARERKLTLAGGLTPRNVSDAIAMVRPYCVDVASGVEAAGDARRKDPALLAAFVAAVRTLPITVPPFRASERSSCAR
jgi:phosphoribosylanthranilate isomerase